MPQVRLRLFAQAREAAARTDDTFDAVDVSSLLDAARQRYGADFSVVLERCIVWVNGEEAGDPGLLHDGDEVAVLPPVSGGAAAVGPGRSSCR